MVQHPSYSDQELLPSRRQIMQLRFEEDLSTAEIAERLNISRKTVQNQLRTALLQMRSGLITILVISFWKEWL